MPLLNNKGGLLKAKRNSYPTYSNIVLKISPTGNIGGTSFSDESSYNRTIYTGGNAVISSFGNKSIAFDGDVDYLETLDTPELVFNNGNLFVIEFEFYWNGRDIVTNAPFSTCIGKYFDDNTNLFRIGTLDNGGNSLSMIVQGTSYADLGTVSITKNKWQKFTWWRDLTSMKNYVDDVLLNTKTNISDIGNKSTTLRIGQNGHTNRLYQESFNGYMRNIKITMQ